VRQHCFPFLTGDPDRCGRRKACLSMASTQASTSSWNIMSASIASVSAFSMTSRRSRECLVVSSAGDMTSGVAIYCRHGYMLVVLEVAEFAHDRAKRLLRLPETRTSLASAFMNSGHKHALAQFYLLINEN
jgi:hypothetical protein